MEYIPPIGGAVNDPYVNPNPGAGEDGSKVPAEAIEYPMREIIAVLEDAGIVPDNGDLTQLSAAIQALISAYAVPDATTSAKGAVELATGPEALGGTDNERAVTAAGLASSQSIAAAGYIKLPGGLILQWGSLAWTAGGDSTKVVAFPITFPTACLVAVPTTDRTSGGSGVLHARVGSWTVSELSVAIDMDTTSTSAGTIYYIAIGH